MLSIGNLLNRGGWEKFEIFNEYFAMYILETVQDRPKVAVER